MGQLKLVDLPKFKDGDTVKARYMNFTFKAFVCRNKQYYQSNGRYGEPQYCVRHPYPSELYRFEPFDFYINESNMSIIRMVLTEKKWKQNLLEVG